MDQLVADEVVALYESVGWSAYTSEPQLLVEAPSALGATVVRGFSIAVAETEAGANDGGSVRMVNSSVLALDEGAPVTVRASEHSGTVDLVNTSLDTRGLLTVVAGQCSGRVGGEVLDCSTDALADALEAP